MPSTKCKGLGYSTHFLKSRGSVIMNKFLELNLPHFLLDEILLRIVRYKYSIGICRAPVVTQFIVKV